MRTRGRANLGDHGRVDCRSPQAGDGARNAEDHGGQAEDEEGEAEGAGHGMDYLLHVSVVVLASFARADSPIDFNTSRVSGALS